MSISVASDTLRVNNTVWGFSPHEGGAVTVQGTIGGTGASLTVNTSGAPSWMGVGHSGVTGGQFTIVANVGPGGSLSNPDEYLPVAAGAIQRTAPGVYDGASTTVSDGLGNSQVIPVTYVVGYGDSSATLYTSPISVASSETIS